MNNFNKYIMNLFEAENDQPEKPIVVNSPNTTIVVKKERRKKRGSNLDPGLAAQSPANIVQPTGTTTSPQSPDGVLSSPNYYEDEPIVSTPSAPDSQLKPNANSILSIPDNVVIPTSPSTSVTPPAMVDPNSGYYEDEFDYNSPSEVGAPQAQTNTPVDQAALSNPEIDIYEDDYNPVSSIAPTIGNAAEETSTPPIPAKDLSRIDNLKNIHSTLLNIRSILNNETDNKYKDLKSKLNDSLGYFGHIIKNLDSYTGVIDDLISKYKRFSFVLVQELDKIKKSTNKPKTINNSKLKLSKQDRDLIVSDVVKKLKNK